MFGVVCSLGAINNYDHQNQDWKIYKSRLCQWFIANDIDETTDKAGVRRKAVLLSALNENTYQLACNLALPEDLDTKNFESILQILDNHFTPKRCGFAERHKFYAGVQQTGETHSQWAARLRGLAAHCAFKNIEDSLLDKFVMGMLPGHERDKLFAQDIKDLTLGKAVELAESIRCARAGAAAVPAPGCSADSSAAQYDTVFKINQQRRSAAKGSQDCSVPCAVCGYKGHRTAECRFSSYTCKVCSRKGHLKRVCPNKKVNYVEQGNSDVEGDDGEFILNITSEREVPMTDTVSMGGRYIVCEIDSGSPVSVISESMYRSNFSDVPLSPPTKKLFTYTNCKMQVVGIMIVNVIYLEHSENLPVYVIRNGGPTLLGRDFMRAFNLRFVSTLGHSESHVHSIREDLTKLFPKVFSDELGCFNKFEIKLPLKSDAKPVFCKSRSVPFALSDIVNDELSRLVALGILKPVPYSDYASPIVPVLKNDGSVRICADYSVSINQQLHVEKYPLPTAQELFSKLHGGVVFSKIDLSMAYNQVKIHEDSQNVTCINTPRGLFNYTRLVFGLASAPAIFQRVIESIVGNIPGVLSFLDDILVTGDQAQHKSRLNEVLRRLEEAGLTVHKDKCSFYQREVSYLGYIIDKHGIRKNPEKVKAILYAPVPKNVSELQSFLGLLNYYRAFVPNASEILSPLHILLQKGAKWHWTTEQIEAFNSIKKSLASDNTLAHFDNNAKLILSVDASEHGLAAIISQIGANGIEQPVSYASRSLNPAEKKYSQIQKEATAIIYGVRKFHQYLYGRSEPFVLRTDHKPLTTIFGKKRGIPEVSANRLQRYAIFLSAYNYTIEYVRSGANTADFLSRAIPAPSASERGARAPAPEKDAQPEVAAYVNFAIEGSLPLTTRQLQTETANDSILKSVSRYVLEGWPCKNTDPVIKPYFLCRNEISIENDVLMRGHKVIIPGKYQKTVLDELHSSHFGIVKMKAEARARAWFPGIDAALERLAAECTVCTQLRPSPARAQLAPWPHPPAAFHRIHLDFLGPIQNKMFLVIVDAFSKWVECYVMNNDITTKAVITKLCDFMSRFGIPNTIVSDNGTSLTSQSFKDFCELNHITHLVSPVFHPMSNGQAESFVKIIKRGIKTFLLSGGKINNIQCHLSKFLFDYRNSNNTTTETSPAQLVFGHKLRSRLDLFTGTDAPLSTELSKLVKRKQCLQVRNYGGKQYVDLKEGDKVYVKQYINKNKFNWLEGTILKKIGKVLYKIKLMDNNKQVVRHKNQIYQSKIEIPSTGNNENTAGRWDVTLPIEESSRPRATETDVTSSHETSLPVLSQESDVASAESSTVSEPPPTADAETLVLMPEATTPELGSDVESNTSEPPPLPSHRNRRNRPVLDYKKMF